MRNTWRTQVQRITVAVIASAALAGGAGLAHEVTAGQRTSISADGTTGTTAPAAEPTASPTPTASPDTREWG
ncbi:hypothetical protein HYE82_31705 [Streptomyces sp. BR123]|uniref:hypothetical protein n=1 Tax=Streptomyces sp. BR123 TaxID=2749828 RepID=UPI0015C43708|nr:hypothetical protein [Streptomyces sp. BR123]NXY98867.1 hypothetical protein [Streptomyces sp. BR123]